MRILAVTAVLLALAACSSSGGGSSSQIAYGTAPVEIAQTMGICAHPVQSGKGALCTFADGGKIVVDSIAGPADQQLAVPTAKQVSTFCELVGHGFEVIGLSYSELKSHVDLNAIVAKYGGTIAGGSC